MNWKTIKRGIADAANKATQKTEEFADLAAIKLKIAKLSSDRENEFIKLGKLTYKKLTCESDSPDKELTEKISKTAERISDITDDINALKLEYDVKKQEAEANKKAKKPHKDDVSDIKIDTSVLDSFSNGE